MNEEMKTLIQSVRCDFSGVTARWSRRWGVIQTDAPLLAEIIYAEIPDDLSDEELRKVQAGKREARQELSNLRDEEYQLVTQVLKHVPRAFLHPDAPESIDWSDEENILDYVLESHLGHLFIGVSLELADNRKNSLTLMPSNGDTPAQMSSSAKKSMSESS